MHSQEHCWKRDLSSITILLYSWLSAGFSTKDICISGYDDRPEWATLRNLSPESRMLTSVLSSEQNPHGHPSDSPDVIGPKLTV
jgi:hypothetical protein